MKVTALSLLLAIAAAEGSGAPSAWDLGRAKTWKPRAEYQGHGTLSSANARLNKHLLKHGGLKTVACEALEAAQLRDTLRTLFSYRNEELASVYPKGDGRHSVYGSVAEMEEHWAQLPLDELGVQRDGHCHEAVMWFIHHLTESAQALFAEAGHQLPLLPEREHDKNGEDASTKLYASKVTCQKCHVGGIDNLGVPEVKPDTPQALARRCYTNYQDLFNITCGPCDGVSGIYTGDDDKYFSAPPCTVVKQPHEVPEAERVAPKLPHQFTVDVTGSDRFGRTTNPVGSNIISRAYGQISGKWYMNAVPGAEMWYLRHDTTYHQLSIDGHQVPFIHQASVSEIHVQSTAQKKANITGPMVSLVHGMPSWIPGGCTCIPDPVGVPDTTATEAAGLSQMDYLGRITLNPIEYEGRAVELDHWANWFFHIFMETDKSAPMYGQAPKRLSSAYAGMAVYSNWTVGDPAAADPSIWNRDVPSKACLNPKKVDDCNDVTDKTFPPKVSTPLTSKMSATKSLLSPIFFPAKHQLEQAVQDKAAEIMSFLAGKAENVIV